MSEQPIFPRPGKSLLSTEEKTFLDGIPDEGVKYILDHPDKDIKASFVAHDMSTTIYHEFKDERATAVKEYFEMLFAYGVRKDPRVA